MILENKRKVEGGKFARIKLEVEGNSLKDVKITGDFFLYPEETLEKIELSLRGMKIPFDAARVEKKIGKVIEEENAELVGITAKDIAEMIGECLN